MNKNLYKVIKAYYDDLNDLCIRLGGDKEFVIDDMDYLSLMAVLDTFDGDNFYVEGLEE